MVVVVLMVQLSGGRINYFSSRGFRSGLDHVLAIIRLSVIGSCGFEVANAIGVSLTSLCNLKFLHRHTHKVTQPRSHVAC